MTALTVLLLGSATVGAVSVVAPLPAAPGAPRPTVSAVSYRAPVDPVVVERGFDSLPSPYLAGHRGVDLRAPATGLIRAPAPGTVSFAGPVAGRGVVVIAHADGVLTSYEPVTAVVTAGTRVTTGAVLGTVAGAHGGFSPGQVLHWGARRDGAYLDPLRLLQPLGPVRLLPW